MSSQKDQVLKQLSTIIDPDLGQDIVTLNFIKNLTINNGDVSFTIELTTPACPIKDVFKNEKYLPKITSTKSLTGHSLGATGVHEAIYTLIMMNNNFICESANIKNIDPLFENIPIVKDKVENVNLGYVLSNSFGFGGTNATLTFKHPDK